MSALLVGGASTFVSCKDFDGDSVAENNAKVAGLDAKLNEQIQQLKDLKTKVDGQGEKIDNLLDRVAKAEDKLAALVWIEDYKAQLTAWAMAQKNDPDLVDYLVGLKSEFPDYTDLVTKQYLAEYCSADTEEFVDAIEDCINEKLAEYLDPNAPFSNVEEFCELVNKIPTFVEMAAQKLAELEGQDKLFQARFDNLVTGINVDMVKNHVFGMLNTPFGLKTSVLGAFYGENTSNITSFPTKRGASKLSADISAFTLTGAGSEKIGAKLVSDAGEIFVTVNPDTIDFSGYALDLVSRSGEAAPGLTPLALIADNTPVSTRATGVSNGQGGYAARVDVKDPEAIKLNLDVKELARVAKDTWTNLRYNHSVDVKGLAETVYRTFDGIAPQDYYAVRADKHAVTSNYQISAFAFKPLGFKTLDEVDLTQYNVPQIPSLEEKLGAYIQNINFDQISAGTIQDMEIVVGDKGSSSSVKVKDKDGNPKTVTVGNTYEFDGALEVTSQVNNSGTVTTEYVVAIPFNKLKVENDGGNLKYTAYISNQAAIQSVIDNINSTIQSKITSVKTTATNKLAAIDTKIISRLNKVVNVFNDKFHNLNYYLQPMLFVGDDNGDLFRLSEVQAAATPVSRNGNTAQLWFHPTSGTAELLAPAYMKYVEVQTVQGGKATINDTDKSYITFNGKDNALLVKFEKGVYRVIYQAVDYFGYTSTKVYYVNVD